MKWLWLLLLIPTAAALGPDAFGYVTIGPDPGLIDYVDISTTGTAMPAASGDGGQPIAFPGYTFDYYGFAKNGGMIAEDGFFMFGSVLGTTNQPKPIPNPALPNDYLAPMWIDNDSDCLIPGDENEPLESGEVYGQSMALPDGDVYITMWDHMPFVFNGLCRGANDYQVKIFGETDIFEFHYQDASNFEDLTKLDECAATTIGFEEGGGASVRGLQWDASVPVLPNSCSKVFSFTNSAMRSWVNDFPDAQDQEIVTPVNTPISFDLDVSDDPLIYTVTATPSGSLIDMPDSGDGTQYWSNQVTYTPVADWAGTDAFTYRVNDKFDVVQVAKVTIIVDGPVTAVDDAFATNFQTALDITTAELLANDSDQNGDTLTITDTTAPSSGTLVATTDGYTYTPDDGFLGEDTWTYTVSDGRSSSQIATVTITVLPVNVLPEGTNDNYGTDKNVQLVVAAPGVLQNDVDDNGDAMTVTLVDDVAQGSLSLAADGSFTYTPNLDYTGTDTFTYTIEDGIGSSDEVTVTITVSPGPVNPTAVDDAIKVDEDDMVTFDVMSNDYDGNGDTFTITSYTQPSGTLTLDGSFTYTPQPNFVGVDSFTYTITDSTGRIATATVTITVNNLNDAPVGQNHDYEMFVNDVLTIAQPGALTGATDADGDALSVVLETDVSNGALTLNADGSFSFTPNADYLGADGFAFRIHDGSVDSIAYAVNFNIVEAPNTPPVAMDDTFTIDEDTLLHASFATLLDNDNDAEGSLTLLGFQPALFGLVVDHGDGTWSYAPPKDWSGTDIFTYTVKDEFGETNEASVIIHVIAVVDPPRVSFDIMAPDGLATGREIQFVSTSLPGDAALASWSWDLDISNAAGQTASQIFTQKRSYTITLVVTDEDGESSSNSHVLTLSNNAPVAGFQVRNPVSDDMAQFFSTSIDDQSLTLLWTIAGSTYITPTVSLQLPAGNYPITLYVEDSFGVADSYSEVVVIAQGVVANPVATQAGGPGQGSAALGPLRADQPPPRTDYPTQSSGKATTVVIDEKPEEETPLEVRTYDTQEDAPPQPTPWLQIGAWLMGAAALGGITAWLFLLFFQRRAVEEK